MAYIRGSVQLARDYQAYMHVAIVKCERDYDLIDSRLKIEQTSEIQMRKEKE